MLIQRDTYFQVSHGRLKLREEQGAAPHLIAYQRPDLAGQRESRYRIVEITQAEELKAALSSALGVKVVVAKERLLFLWQGVRIHLDRVDGPGQLHRVRGDRAGWLGISRARRPRSGHCARSSRSTRPI